MINYEALLKLTYGLYIVSSGDVNKGNGFISNTFFQVTSEPALYYRQVKKGLEPKNAPTYIDKSKPETKEPAIKAAKHKCSVCGYVYDDAVEKVRFADLPDDWTCPICGSDKEDFIEL